MANTRRTCTGCNHTFSFEVGDEEKENGEQIIWECPDFECSTRNIIEGTTPAEMALERVGQTDQEGVRSVTDTDTGTTGDQTD